MERFRQIAEYPRYLVSSYGRIMSYAARNKIPAIMKPLIANGYRFVELHHSGKMKKMKISRLVAMSFIPNPESKGQVNHIDGDKSNDYLENLEWATASENTQHAYDNGLTVLKRLNESPNARPVEQLTKGGKFIKRYGSLLDAGIQNGYAPTNIGRVARGQRGTAYQYKWRYCE